MAMDNNLPQDWQWVKLKEISEIISKGTTPTGGKQAYLSQGISFLRAENILDNGEVDLSSAKFISKEQHTNQLKRSQLKNNDILITIAGTLGRSAILKTTQECNTNQAISFVRLKREFISYASFIQKYLTSPIAQKKLISQAKTTAIPNLTLQIISDTKIPLPPLEIQREIVEILESKLEKIQEAKALLETSLQNCESYRASLLNDAFSGNLTPHSKNWQWVRLGEITEIIGGTTPSTTNSEYWNGEFYWITPAEIHNDSKIIYTTKRQITQKAIKDKSLKLLPIGTILLSSRAPIGKVAIAGSEMYCNQGFKNLVCDEEKIYNLYLFYFLKSKTAFLNSLGRGTTFKEISKSIIEKIQIPLPPLEIQREIVEILESKLEKIQEAKTLLESSLQNCESYRASLLESAFRGELV